MKLTEVLKIRVKSGKEIMRDIIMRWVLPEYHQLHSIV